MKVLSIEEPFATLIASEIKRIETRSWKTNYRGEIFIHASGKTLSKGLNDSVLALIEGLDMNYGNIICRCNLVDCIYMDEVFLKKLKQNPIEYSCGDYQIGRYAWVLEDVELIEPITAKGQLGIWNFSGNYKLKDADKRSVN